MSKNEKKQTTDDKDNFNLLIAIDIEHERVLLYRILVVLELIGAFLLIREGVIAWLGL